MVYRKDPNGVTTFYTPIRNVKLTRVRHKCENDYSENSEEIRTLHCNRRLSKPTPVQRVVALQFLIRSNFLQRIHIILKGNCPYLGKAK
ncbi:hypothetical protein DQM28_13740 [Leptospira mayottensis]|uniref:Uncharacterized protein n=1 Tax=Leptospira mayottensis TaxID=1137606 RepID=A0ABM6YAU7_9LEPT|nr:hypothetical protein DQM28_13740 [Leptospira mayottensis]